MRIGLAADTYKPYISGVTNFTSLVKAELERQGHEVVVFTFGVPGEALGEDNVIYSPGFRLRMGYSFGLRYSKEARRRMMEMDLLHLQHPFVTGQLILGAVGERKPLIFTAHTRYDFFSVDYLPKVFAQFGQSLLRWYLPRFCRRMARVICNSPASVEGMQNCCVDVPFDLVPNGVDLKPFQNAIRNVYWRERMGNWPVQFLYTGRLAVEKSLPFLLDAFALLAKRNPSVGLALVGGGPMEQVLRERSKRLNLNERIIFLGSVAYERMPEIVASADIFVMPSVKDTHPLTVIEAMAAGLPAVVVQSPAYIGTIEHEKNGLVCLPSVEALAQGMEIMAEDGNLRYQLGMAARISALNYSIENSTRQILAIYSAVLDEWKRRPSQ